MDTSFAGPRLLRKLKSLAPLLEMCMTRSRDRALDVSFVVDSQPPPDLDDECLRPWRACMLRCRVLSLDVTDRMLEKLLDCDAELPFLERLSYGSKSREGEAVMPFPGLRMPQLKSVTFGNVVSTHTSFLETVSRQLTDIAIHYHTLSPDCLAQLQDSPNLKALTLTSLLMADGDYEDVYFPTLEKLSCSFHAGDYRDVLACMEVPNLRTLRLEAWGEHPLVPLVTLVVQAYNLQLERLYLEGCELLDDIPQFRELLKSLPSLVHLAVHTDYHSKLSMDFAFNCLVYRKAENGTALVPQLRTLAIDLSSKKWNVLPMDSTISAISESRRSGPRICMLDSLFIVIRCYVPSYYKYVNARTYELSGTRKVVVGGSDRSSHYFSTFQ
ncbi:hypothetical protein GLOTRDRAFT_131234 [Gloeophyllum trabeum ATCC 11539]|uniref:F-box domain-containing protein n=1 Tax=Gloeophyllum trabeum (strain ATCC 11539 / FP-39264 / Madison 617) TaxID=670483 RepID=S7RJY6_GLOTA|nr:uncharacterized protein GLOTRDRAFT_131234 [Gloeophyllum trabeum ATCC 11539]EPQ52949.1 hypothetical protein GLOTRDRAFT_131234 [Gloeophyllum trabeum ATCC 11539]